MHHLSSDHQLFSIKANENTQLTNENMTFLESLSPASPPKSIYELGKQNQLNGLLFKLSKNFKHLIYE